MIKLAICGISGRMGTRILALAKADADVDVVYGLEASEKPAMDGVHVGCDASHLSNADAIIDFTIPEATMKNLPTISKLRKPLVIGTTGFTDEQNALIHEASKLIPIVQSPNMSLGVNVFFKVAQETARALPGYKVHIEETHHVHKKDAPSGTALRAGDLVEKASGQKVTYESFREGEVVGDHRVIFTGPSDRLELFHHAGSRDTFAAGAIQAAKWVVGRNAGLYTMWDVLSL